VTVIDVDTLAGHWPLREADISLPTLLATLDRHAIDACCVTSARGIFYDDLEGNDETLAWCAANPQLIPTGTLDPRRFVGYRDEVRRLTAAGVRIWRLFPELQSWVPDTAPFRRIVSALADEGAVLFVSGQPSHIVRAISGTPLRLILGAHFYQMADLLALLEEGADFYVSTRLLHGPGAIETLVGELGPDRLIFGSGAPLSAMGAALLRVQTAALPSGTKDAIFGGNLLRLLGREAV
jgi:predicted TIM-barrel fold metal-dependent hydrolase